MNKINDYWNTEVKIRFIDWIDTIAVIAISIIIGVLVVSILKCGG